ncbi:MAG: glycosyltransferase family 2 protein, partial [Candidatus Cryptobacteroides sp.]
MPAVSIIIPVYNAREYIVRCLESIINQTFKDWEAICVDDGSIDSSPWILDDYASRDPRIKVITQPNAGVSAARNTALEAACGDYVCFVDSDDFLHPQTLELALFAAGKENGDLVAYTYDRSFRTRLRIRHIFGMGDGKQRQFRKYVFENIEYKVTDDIFGYVTEYSDGKIEADSKKWAVKHCQPWRCLYRSSCVRHLRFRQGIIYEDFPWWGEVLLNVRRAVILNLPLYFYYPNKGSYISSSKQKYRIESLRKALEVAQAAYRNATERQKSVWERNFMTP